MKILLLSDTHGYIDDNILGHAKAAEEVWHAGDFGTPRVSDQLAGVTLLRGVYGNIDGAELRKMHPLVNAFEVEGLKVLMIHIGGYPGHYPANVRELIRQYQPGLFICGHSHILKVTRDPGFQNMLCINPGAAGNHGFHRVKTIVRFNINGGKVSDLDVIETTKSGSF